MSNRYKVDDLIDNLDEAQFKNITVRLTKEEKDALDEMCRTSFRSLSDMVRFALSDVANKWGIPWPQ